MLLMEYLTLGKVKDAFGLDGTLKILSSSYFSSDRYQEGNKIILTNGNKKEELTVVSYRGNKDVDYVKFLEIKTKEEALERKGYLLQIEKDESFLNKGEYYFSDLEKCEVYDEDNNLLGKVKRVEEFPSTITLRVARENNKDFFVPFLEQFIVNVDIKNHKIIIHVIGGMLWELPS